MLWHVIIERIICEEAHYDSFIARTKWSAHVWQDSNAYICCSIVDVNC